tara:strand:+ start:194 stop:928 length:735 start_codon:yes stop_codon:yes gene_type:complete
MSVSYLQQQYIDDISNNTYELKDQYEEFQKSISNLDASLNESMDNITDNTMNNMIENVIETNDEYKKNKQSQIVQWFKKKTSNFMYLNSVENDHKLVNKIILYNLKENDKNEEKGNQIKTNQKRMYEILNYNESKRNHLIIIFKVCVIILCILFIISLLFHLRILPETIFVILIGIGLAILVIYVGKASMDIAFRDNIFFNEYNFPKPSSNSNESSEVKSNEIPLHHRKDKLSEKCYSEYVSSI